MLARIQRELAGSPGLAITIGSTKITNSELNERVSKFISNRIKELNEEFDEL